MKELESEFYEFGPFKLDAAERRLVHGDKVVPLTPKLFGLLMTFVQSGGATLSKDVLAKAVWPDTIVTDAALAKNISRLKRTLRDGEDGQRYIETLSGVGYRFIATARPVFDRPPIAANLPGKDATSAVRPPEMAHDVSTTAGPQVARFRWHVFACALLYAGLYVVTLFLESAYQFERLGPWVLKLSPFILLWVFGTSVGGLWVGRGLAVREKGHLALIACVMIFLCASAIVYWAVCQILPASPVTESVTQAQSAQSAYLKDIYYSLIPAVLFVIPPYCFVVRMRQELLGGRHASSLELLTGNKLSAAPPGTVYVRLWVLGLALMSMALLSVYLTANLLDHIKPSRYMNLFTNMIYLRLVLYYGLGVECLAWYHWALNDLKRECLTIAGARSYQDVRLSTPPGNK